MSSEIDENAPLRVLFPQYWKLDSMVRGEVSGLSDVALDWTSDEFGWAGWSVRRQTSHLASVVYRWLQERWREQLFPAGQGGVPLSDAELSRLSSPEHDRRLNDDFYWSMDDILDAVSGSMELAQSVLRRVTVAQGRSLVVQRSASPQWWLMVKAHPHGVTLDESGGGTLTLEATFRHMYYEYLTHLYNMQRIKRALGETVVVRLPDEGYHTVEGWD